MSHSRIVTEVLEVTLAAGARIDDGDLTALLYAQGIGARSLWRDKTYVVLANAGTHTALSYR